MALRVGVSFWKACSITWCWILCKHCAVFGTPLCLTGPDSLSCMWTTGPWPALEHFSTLVLGSLVAPLDGFKKLLLLLFWLSPMIGRGQNGGLWVSSRLIHWTSTVFTHIALSPRVLPSTCEESSNKIYVLFISTNTRKILNKKYRPIMIIYSSLVR